MKKPALWMSILLVVVIPNMLFSFFTEKDSGAKAVPEESAIPCMVQQEIKIKDGDLISEIALDEYVLRVLLGEMPSDFEPDALMAQAIAIRTYTLRNILRGSKHQNADVCTDPSCCQSFVEISDYAGSRKDLDKLMQAVNATENQVLTFQGNLIEATYFSCSGGKTEDAVAVWGTDVPYLQSVSSPGEENAKRYISITTCSYRDFLRKLGLPENTDLSAEKFHAEYTEGGGVAKLYITDRVFTGVQIRTLLGLPSTAFTITVANDNVHITTKGNGHRVGLSQYGAEAMAVSGKTYPEILAHYYAGTELVTFTSEQMKAVFDKAGNL